MKRYGFTVVIEDPTGRSFDTTLVTPPTNSEPKLACKSAAINYARYKRGRGYYACTETIRDIKEVDIIV